MASSKVSKVVICKTGPPTKLVSGLHGEHRCRRLTWGKGLFSHDFDTFERVVSDHGRNHPVAPLELVLDFSPLFTSKQDRATLLLGLLDGVRVSLEGELGVQRPNQGILLLRCAHTLGSRTECLDERGNKGIGDARVDQETPSSSATLSSGSQSSKKDTSESKVLVGIGKDDGGLSYDANKSNFLRGLKKMRYGHLRCCHPTQAKTA
jgi:hypothetical protein